MNRSDYDDYPPRRIYRDSENGVILGVCAGIAAYFDWPIWLTRLGVFAVGWFLSVPVLIAYIVAALLMPERPLRYYGDGEERAFWQSRNHRS